MRRRSITILALVVVLTAWSGTLDKRTTAQEMEVILNSRSNGLEMKPPLASDNQPSR
jgi:hypothetical protein